MVFPSRAAAAALLLVCGVSLGLWPGETNARLQTGAVPTLAPRLRPADILLDFGRIEPGREARRSFVLHNDGNAELFLGEPRPSCGCATVKLDSPVPPGGTGRIEVALSARSVRPGTIASHIEVASNDPDAWLFLVRAEVAADDASR